ncbi:MAG TPA: DUF4145 domain-containing protein [Pararhizobium sp.]|uniref:DUF4145 domain-containing protein n=1 Tax=Pararhizobium sp. TaxID=1977563 RepID=UPI002BB56F62|nr:DUF4145 domain-containing protein [Pararhizobium sp.]HTO31309.1 DUF4145 domain-containing protein [Pararhizobium sp.]
MNDVQFPTSAAMPIEEFLFVPDEILAIYQEAVDTISVSPRASALLSRCCAEVVLARMGYKGNLLNAVTAASVETKPYKALSATLRQTLLVLRYIGNAAAHPHSGGPSEIEFEDAEWCLEIVGKLFREYYEEPEFAQMKISRYTGQLFAAGIKKLPV